MDSITWPVAATIISGLAVLFGYLAQIYGRRNLVTKKDFDDITESLRETNRLVEHRTTVIEGKIELLTSSIKDIRISMVSHTELDDKNFDRIDDRLEKITDLMIDMIQNEKK